MFKLRLFILAAAVAVAFGFNAVNSFRPSSFVKTPARVSSKNGARGMTAVLDIIAGLSLAAQLNSAPNMESRLMSNSMTVSVAETKQGMYSNSMTVSVAETKQGMYKEYTVERVDDKSLDEIKRGYKTAEETDESKNKYWAIFAVLVAGSFVIPMAQYYWYVAEED